MISNGANKIILKVGIFINFSFIVLHYYDGIYYTIPFLSILIAISVLLLMLGAYDE